MIGASSAYGREERCTQRMGERRGGYRVSIGKHEVRTTWETQAEMGG